MYLKSMGLRGSEPVSEIHHTRAIHWIREAGHQLPSAPESEQIPEVTDLDEVQTFIGRKSNKVWIWTAVNHRQAGILAWVVGYAKVQKRSSGCGKCVLCWHCFFCVTDESDEGLPNVY